MLGQEKLAQLISVIKQKKELQGMSDSFVYSYLLKYLQQHPRVNLLNQRAESFRKIVKEIRAELRRVHGLFRTPEEVKERKELLERYRSSSLLERKEIINTILTTHASTKERILFYPNLYRQIFAITGKPKTILDLGCGINPFSVIYTNLKNVNYFAYDINTEDVELINAFFKIEGIKGNAKILDLFAIGKLPSAEIAFFFKMTDVLERGKGHKISELILAKIPAKFVVVSFPTVTVSGKRMNFPRRRWIELMCQRLGYSYEALTFENEIFYVINKSPKKHHNN